ncbi:MAG TPA: plastocyanin/azurin family copper-binding protein [Acidimicrobiia bacterium]|jgi:amicyanin|nr:plastocyanin/azurin family copper-binding protein [Acidimicrobiia bacterium]
MKTTAIALLLALVLGACADQGGSSDSDAASQTPVEDPVITIADMEFQNGNVTIEEGTTVTWVWEDAPMEHNVVFDEVESPLQAEGTWTHTFEDAGTYDYHCAPHPFMKGTITVIEAASEAGA